ncbi:thiol reductant ABC exporter subunit CydD [Streptomyces sp. NPDC007088]|uniref:thiol reductant ABC exporter subunit CydD n=1 Tax=Streptomyces sp. NPDC007088 TaxID=3364773 RepID=UPI0036978B80
MKPIDPRLLHYARATRLFLVAVVVLGVLGALLVIGQAMLIAEIVVGAFEHGMRLNELATPLLLLAAVALGRALVSWLTELSAHRASAAVKSELRSRLLRKAAELGPAGLDGQRTGSLVNLATRGVDALDDYFSRYLPQLGLALAVPVAVLARIVTEDWVSALIIVITLPLIPVFMMLIGWATQSRMDRQWELLSRLSGHFLDVVAGLPTLKVFGRAKAQAESIRTITDSYRRATMRTLRIAFLSSFALELLSTLSVALVAVTIGMRLVHGDMDLYVGLVVLVLAPEAYLPLRQVGAQYHAAAEGLSAAEEVFAVLEARVPQAGTGPVPERGALRWDAVTVRYPGRDEPAVERFSLSVAPGETVALVGPSGAGKSTVLSTVLGFVRPESGRLLFGGTDLTTVAPERLHERIAWVPQQPTLFAGTVGENVLLARPEADDAAVEAALRAAGAWEFVSALPQGMHTPLGEDGTGLSAGQRQRLALARAFLADRPVLLLDEPTAALDGSTEAEIVEAVRRLVVGRTVLLVVHRPALLAVADRVVRVGRPVRQTVPGGSAAAEPDHVLASPDRVPAEPDQVLARVAGAGPERDGSSAPVRVAASREAALREEADEGRTAVSAAERAGAGRGVLRRVRDIGRARWGRLSLALMLGALALGSAVGLMATSGWLISRASQEPPVLYLMVAVTATRAFGIGRSVFRYTERLVSHDAVLRMLADTRVAVFRGLERLSPAGLRGRRRGDLLSRLVADVDAFQDYWLRWLLPAGAAVVVGAGTVGFTAWLLPAAGMVLAAGLLLAGVGVPLLTVRGARRAERQLAPARGDLAVRVTDVLTGTGELTVAGALPGRLRAAVAADRRLTRIASRASALTALGDGLTALITGLTVAACAAVAVPAVAQGRLSGVALAVVVLTPLAAFEAVTGMPVTVQYRERVRRSAERVHEVLDAPAPVREPVAPRPAPVSPFPLRLHGVSARYAGRERDALRDLDLTIPEGRRIAVVGSSGSGKTTLAQVLLRFLDPAEGDYLLGGTRAEELPGDVVRRFVGLCAQDAHHFDSSIRENLLLARKEAGEPELRSALDRARLLGWVDSLPDGLDTMIGEHGARLSGGQRQRLALARALLADFPVLVLDEPAEHLDLETADALTTDLLAATEGHTTVLITHRLAGLEGAVDEVLVLDEGRVVQRGDVSELLRSEGPLKEMWVREREAERLLAVGGSAGDALPELPRRAPSHRGGPAFAITQD